MKKMLKGLAGFAVVLVLVVGVVATVFASESKQGDVTIKSDKDFTITEETGWTPLTTQKAAELIGGGVTADQLQIVWQKVINGTAPIDITFTYDPTTADQTLYVFHNSFPDNDVWDLNATGTKGAKSITASFSSLSPVALVVYTPSNAGGKTTPATDGKSPKTGEVDYLLFAALAAVLVGGVVAGVAVRKNKA